MGINSHFMYKCLSDQSSNTITLAGITQDVETCLKKIEQILEVKDLSALTPEQRMLYLSEMPVSAPDYWSDEGKSMSRKTQKDTEGKRCAVDDKLSKAIEELIQKSWRAEVVGMGKDAQGLKHKCIEVKKVERIEQRHLWNAYDTNRRQFMGIASSNPYVSIAAHDGEEDILTYTCSPQELDKHIEKAINEAFLFHGTKENLLNVIISQGFDFRLTTNAMFGRGVYFAESSTKADQYTGR